MECFSDRLIRQIQEKKSLICIGLDPRIEEKNTIPHFILKKTREMFDDIDLADNEAIWLFNKGIIDATHDITPIYKPQIAFYEKYHALDALKRTIEYIHKKGSLALLDAKRNDIGSTSGAYAENVFEYFEADAVTVNSYFGIDGVKPFLEYVRKGKGIVLLLKTSNPSSGEFQDLFSIELPTIDPKISEVKASDVLSETKNTQIKLVRNYIKMTRLMKKWALDEELVPEDSQIGKNGYSNLAGVVGATYPEQLQTIRKEIPRSFILIPGFGAQGGTAKDIVNGVNKDGLGAIVNSSRGIDFAYQKPEYAENFNEEEYAKASRKAAKDMRDQINNAIEAYLPN